MEVVDGKALVLRTKLHETILENIPKSRYLRPLTNDIHEVAVFFGPNEVAALKQIGFKKVPAAPLRTYQYPGRFTPMQHQKTTAEFLVSHKKAFVFSDMGTGKSAAAAWAADYLLTLNPSHRVLIICPVSIMQAAWQNDLFNTLMHRSVGIAYGTRAQRAKIIDGDYEIVIINYDGLVPMLDELIAAKFDIIIGDEANMVKNTQANRWKALNKIVRPETTLWLMTGTPAAQSPEDAFGLAKLVCPDRVPKYYGAWRDLVMQKITMFKWIPKPRAKELVFTALQPAIRFTKEECLDLPDIVYVERKVEMTAQQQKYYAIMKHDMIMQAAGESITAVNAASNMIKLLQIACITGDTEVLSDSGWKRLDSITINDLVWDGVEWVAHDGLIYKGMNTVVSIDGVRMTADHRVLTTSGWQTAKDIIDGKSSKKFNRANVRLPDSYSSRRDNTGKQNTKSIMALPMQVWKASYTREPVPTVQTPHAPKKLWMSSRKRNTQNVLHTPVQYMVGYEAALFRSAGQRLQKLWCAGYNGLYNMGRLIRAVLVGHAGWISSTLNFRAKRQSVRIYQTELSMGNNQTTIKQYQSKHMVGHSKRKNDYSASCRSVWNKISNTIRSVKTIPLAADRSTDKTARVQVYDIHNVGPRNRFVVRGSTGTPVIVHNCGAAYDDEGGVIRFDCKDRLNVMEEVIEASDKRVIVFAPFTHTIRLIEEFLKEKGYITATIDGSVSMSKRGTIIKAFQDIADTSGPQIIIIQPQAASHGITLTAASTVIWFAPTNSVDTWLQANARAHRKGQDTKVTVIKLCGSQVEEKMYAALEGKLTNHTSLLELYAELISS